jgi:lipoprotein NlpD
MIVQPGDTLYGIAQTHDVSLKELMRINGLRTSHIQPGQILVIPTDKVEAPEPSQRGTIQSAALPPLSQNPDPEGVDPQLAQEIANADRPVAATPGVFQGQEASFSPPLAGASELQWPLKGNVVSQFSKAARRDGIRIKGKPGEIVTASKAGKVVIAQKNYESFGNILVVQSPDNSLIAYGLLDKFKVNPKDVVKVGYPLGVLGKEAKLYFEVRKLGKPVDPLPLLGSSAPAA